MNIDFHLHSCDVVESEFELKHYHYDIQPHWEFNSIVMFQENNLQVDG